MDVHELRNVSFVHKLGFEFIHNPFFPNVRLGLLGLLLLYVHCNLLSLRLR
jgi:hypothetical protein